MASKFADEKTWVANMVFCFFFLSSVIPMTMAGRPTGTTTGGGDDEDSSRQTLEVQKHFKNLNRPAVKSIMSPDGDIVDCVHVLKQPAFDHPKLKNHKLQMRPNFYPEGITLEDSKNSSKSEPIAQLWHQSGSCPEGTVPIRRSRKIEFGMMKKHRSIAHPRSAQSQPQGVHEYAIAFVKDDRYYGAKANMNVWKPIVQQFYEFSLSQIWILSGTFGKDLNGIEAGWQVYPHLYGDNNTRLFIYWTSDSYQTTGCYDLACSGFIQTSSKIVLGGSLSPLSSYGGSQYEITILIWKDPINGNWWMQYGKDDVVGYWPSSLFTHLSDSASAIEWGGEVVNTESEGQHSTTQMGSGHFPEEGYGKASYFNNIKVVNGKNQLVPPSGVGTDAEKSNCYNVRNSKSADWGTYLYYGGPGRNPNCP